MSERSRTERVALRARDIADLAVASGYPCISVILPTRPASRMTRQDRTRLDELVEDVQGELSRRNVMNRSMLLEKLAEQVDRAADQPTSRTLCIYVSRALARSFRLPQPVTALAVVESSFATRPLVTALHRMPPHVMLLLHPTCAHLYAAEDGGLRPVGRCEPFDAAHPIRIPEARQAGASSVRADLTSRFLRRVDRMLGDYRVDHPSPLVLVGPARLLDEFCAVSGHLERLAAKVDDRRCATALDLALVGITAVEAYLRTRRDEALGLLRQTHADRPSDVASGIEECWRVVGLRRPAMLVVEENFISAGTSAPGRDARPGAPGQTDVHDLVDDLMEQVILMGGQLALVEDGDLAAFGQVALVLRR